MQSLEELLNVEDPVWPEVQKWLQEAKNLAEVLPASDPQRSKALLATQVSVKSTLGAIIYHTGWILMDHGWLRILGSGHPRLPRSLPAWNSLVGTHQSGSKPPFFLIGDDVVGGFFAADGGGLGAGHGEIFYFAPDSLRWENTKKGYTDWFRWCLLGDLAKYYENLRWPGWEKEIENVHGDQGISVCPPPWTTEGKNLEKCSRRPIPIAELYGVQQDARNQLGP